MKLNKAFIRMTEMKPRFMKISDLTEESRKKVHDTFKYAIDANGESDRRAVMKRCVIAQLAEQYVAEWMEGTALHGDEDLEDPWTYAFDVLAGPKYYGMRIEVKTHQSDSSYITVNTGHDVPYPGSIGLNLRPFLNFSICDLIIFFDTNEVDGGWMFEPFLVSDRDSLKSEGVVKKSQYSGYYLNKYPTQMIKNNLNLFYY